MVDKSFEHALNSILWVPHCFTLLPFWPHIYMLIKNLEQRCYKSWAVKLSGEVSSPFYSIFDDILGQENTLKHLAKSSRVSITVYMVFPYFFHRTIMHSTGSWTNYTKLARGHSQITMFDTSRWSKFKLNLEEVGIKRCQLALSWQKWLHLSKLLFNKFELHCTNNINSKFDHIFG